MLVLSLLLIAGAIVGAMAMVLRTPKEGRARLDFARLAAQTFKAIGAAPLLFMGVVLATSAAPVTLVQVAATISGVASLIDIGPTLAALAAASLIMVAIQQLGHMVLVQATLDALDDRAIRPRLILARVLPLLPRGIALAILWWIAIVIGLSFFFVPGIILCCLWFVPSAVLVAERTGIFTAFARSAALTAGVRWHIFLLLCIGLVFWLVVQSMIGGIAALADGATASTIVYAALSALLGTIPPALVAATYHSLRTQKEGLGSDALEQVFA
ncbi:hypothetical protein [Sphingomonas baiyangensis]|uniref:hypothetical protein n=1 Tax=Sphingomonas baiyangensis TaxID=2572576 RepID=UPI0010AE74B6|nr:hypothetical protein [Sphingomonas baiyangensis]